MDIKNKLRNWLDERWDYEIKCDVFKAVDIEELKALARLYDIDDTGSRIAICTKLSKILNDKKKEYEEVLGKDRIECLNDTDPITSTEVKDIDSRSLISIRQENRTYCFDIEGLYSNIFRNNNIKNPYNNVEFDDETIKSIKNSYKKFIALKGKKFDADAYSTQTNLKALVTQLTNYLPYTSGIEKFLSADRRLTNEFVRELARDGMVINIPQLDENVRIHPLKDTKLIQEKIYIIQKLIKMIVASDNAISYALTDIWVYLFHDAPKRGIMEILYFNLFGSYT